MAPTGQYGRPPRPEKAARPAHLGHRPLQLPLQLLHARKCSSSTPSCPTQPLLSFEEITAWRVFVAHGVIKMRLTGGEPLLRSDLERLVASWPAIRGTDGRRWISRSPPTARCWPQGPRTLKEAGLQRVTVSLDALDDTVFRA